MPLDDVASDFRGMAGRQIVRHPEPFLYGIQIAGLEDLCPEASVLEVLNPAQTAAAVGVAVDVDGRLLHSKDVCRLQESSSREEHEAACQLQIGTVHLNHSLGAGSASVVRSDL